jgi:hypothetical protein
VILENAPITIPMFPASRPRPIDETERHPHDCPGAPSCARAPIPIPGMGVGRIRIGQAEELFTAVQGDHRVRQGVHGTRGEIFNCGRVSDGCRRAGEGEIGESMGGPATCP